VPQDTTNPKSPTLLIAQTLKGKGALDVPVDNSLLVAVVEGNNELLEKPARHFFGLCSHFCQTADYSHKVILMLLLQHPRPMILTDLHTPHTCTCHALVVHEQTISRLSCGCGGLANPCLNNSTSSESKAEHGVLALQVLSVGQPSPWTGNE
jgi:hypothetical protein